MEENMKNMPDVFKPNIKKRLENNNKFFYSAQENEGLRKIKEEKNYKNIKQEVLLNPKVFNKKYLIKTITDEYFTSIVDKMGNNIIIESGKVVSISDIVGIFAK